MYVRIDDIWAVGLRKANDIRGALLLPAEFLGEDQQPSEAAPTAPFILLVWATQGRSAVLAEVDENTADSFASWRADKTGVTDMTESAVDSLIAQIATEETPGWTPSRTFKLRAVESGHSSSRSVAEIKADSPDPARKKKIKNVDEKTVKLISEGFTYNSKTFSTSRNAQLTYIGMYAGRSLLSYPVVINNIDDTDTESLADADEVEAFYTAFVTSLRGILDGGTSLKDSLRAASTEAAVAAVTDNR